MVSEEVRDYRTLLQLVFSASDMGNGHLVDDPTPWAYFALNEVPEPGDVIAYPVPWRTQYLVKRVAEGQGFDSYPYILGDLDELGCIWYDLDIHGERCAVDDSPEARRLIVRRFRPDQPESRSYLFT
ncbi:MAG: hypothetical protein ACTHON_12370 [Humibacter sp.]